MHLWDKFGGGRIRQIFLVTESKSFPERRDVQVIHPKPGEYRGSRDWMGMVASALRQVESEYFFFTLDDFFLKGPLDWPTIDKFVDIMIRNEGDTLALGVHDTTRRGCEIGVPGLLEVDPETPYWLTTSPGLWKRRSMLAVLEGRSGSAWEFEFSRREDLPLVLRQYMVDRRSMFLTPVWPYYAEFWAGVDAVPVLSDSAIAKGKWQRGIPAFFAHHGIRGVSFWKRGFHDYYPHSLAGSPSIRARILLELATDMAIRPSLRRKAWSTLKERIQRAFRPAVSASG